MPDDAPDANANRLEPVLMLKSSAMFTELEIEALLPLARRARILELAAGERRAFDEDDERRVLFVHDGTVALRRDGQSEDRAGSGATCGFVECLADAPGAFALAAETDAIALELTRSDLISALDESFPVQRSVVGELGRLALALRHVLPPSERSTRRPSPSEADGEVPTAGAQIRLLSQTQALGRLRVHTLGKLALGGSIERFAAGETLWKRGDPADSCVLVLDGALERIDAGTLRAATVGSLAGLSDTLARAERPDEARARSDARVLRLRAELFYDTIEDDPEAAEDLISVLARGVLLARRFQRAQPGAAGRAADPAQRSEPAHTAAEALHS